MKNNDLVSIIIPVYNMEKYLKKCVNSVINQTYKNIEIILIDDGSKDNSLEICNEFKKKDKRIKVVHKENGGLSSARNFGIKLANGKYITFLDSDDFIHRNMIKNLYEIAIKENCDIVGCNGVIYNDFSKKEENIDTENYTIKFYSKEECLKNCHLSTFLTATKKLYNIEIFKDLRFKENIIHEDAQIAPYIYSKIQKMGFCDLPYYYRFYRDDSITHSNFSKKNFDLIKIAQDRIRFYQKNKYDYLYEQGYVYLLSNIIFLFLKAYYGNASKSIRKEIIKIYKENYKKYYSKITLKNRIKYFSFYCMPNLTTRLLNVVRSYNEGKKIKLRGKMYEIK